MSQVKLYWNRPLGCGSKVRRISIGSCTVWALSSTEADILRSIQKERISHLQVENALLLEVTAWTRILSELKRYQAIDTVEFLDNCDVKSIHLGLQYLSPADVRFSRRVSKDLLTESTIEKLLQIRNLRCLTIERCPELTEEAETALLTRLTPRLRDLRIGLHGMPQESRSQLAVGIVRCSEKHVCCVGCRGLSSEWDSYHQMLANCNALRSTAGRVVKAWLQSTHRPVEIDVRATTSNSTDGDLSGKECQHKFKV